MCFSATHAPSMGKIFVKRHKSVACIRFFFFRFEKVMILNGVFHLHVVEDGTRSRSLLFAARRFYATTLPLPHRPAPASPSPGIIRGMPYIQQLIRRRRVPPVTLNLHHDRSSDNSKIEPHDYQRFITRLILCLCLPARRKLLGLAHRITFTVRLLRR